MKINSINSINSLYLKSSINKVSTNPITFSAKPDESDSFVKNKDDKFIEIKGINKDFDLEYTEKLTKDGLPIERKTFFDDGKTLWRKEEFKNGLPSKTQTYAETGELVYLTTYEEGVISEERHYNTEDEQTFISMKDDNLEITKEKTDGYLNSIKTYKNGIIDREKFFHEDGKTLHLDFKHDENGNLTGIDSFREDGTPYHSIWEARNGFCPEKECEDEFGIPYKDYPKIFGKRKKLPWAKS